MNRKTQAMDRNI